MVSGFPTSFAMPYLLFAIDSPLIIFPDSVKRKGGRVVECT